MSQSISSEEFLAFVSNGQKAQASVNRKIGGARAAASGKDFEQALEITHDWYRLKLIADVYRLPVNTAPMPPGWMRDPKRSGIARILCERQRADYGGFLHKSGRAVVMEAKALTTRARSLPIIPEKGKGSGLKMHQLRALVEAHRWGAFAALVWRNGEERLVVPGKVLEQLLHEARLGLTRMDRSYGTPFHVKQEPECGGLEDWLSAAFVAAQA